MLGLQYFVAYLSIQFATELSEFVSSDAQAIYYPANVMYLHSALSILSIVLTILRLSKRGIRRSVFHIVPATVTAIVLCAEVVFLLSGRIVLD